MKIKDGKLQYNKDVEIPVILIALMIIDFSIFYNKKHIQMFMYIFISVGVLSILYLIKRPKKVIEFLNSFSFIWIITIFSMYFLYTYIFEVYDNYNPEHLIAIFIATLLVGMLSKAIPKNKIIDAIAHISIISAMSICIYIMHNEVLNILAGGTRIGTTGSGNVNVVAMYLAFLLIPMLYKILIEKNKKYFIPILITTVFILLTGSKKGILIILTSIIIIEIYINKFKIIKYIKPIIFMSAILLIIFNTKYFYNIIRV